MGMERGRPARRRRTGRGVAQRSEDSAASSRFRSTALVLLLIGSLLPAVGVGWGIIAPVLCFVPAVTGLLGPAKTKRAFLLVLAVFGVMTICAVGTYDPEFSYAEAKFDRLWSLTMVSTLVAVLLVRGWSDVRRLGGAWL